MKIVCVDNFSRENRSDILVVPHVSPYYGDKIVKALNQQESSNSSDYYALKEDDYELYDASTVYE